MFQARKKIIKEKGAEPDEFEERVAQSLSDLEQNSQSDLKVELRELYIVGAKNIEVGGRKAMVIFVPFRQLKAYHKIQTNLVKELEKKWSNQHVLIVAHRKIQRRPMKGHRQPKQKRPHSRSLTSVHDSILEDLVYPNEIVGKHTRYRVDGSKQLKVYLDPKYQAEAWGQLKVDTFGSVYRKLTGKEVSFEFPVDKME